MLRNSVVNLNNRLMDLEGRLRYIEKIIKLVEETNKVPMGTTKVLSPNTGPGLKATIPSPLEFLRSHPGIRFTIDTLIVNIHQSEDVIQRALDLDYSFRRIRKGHFVRTNIIYYWWESSLDS